MLVKHASSTSRESQDADFNAAQILKRWSRDIVCFMKKQETRVGQFIALTLQYGTQMRARPGFREGKPAFELLKQTCSRFSHALRGERTDKLSGVFAGFNEVKVAELGNIICNI